ncbi:MAG TPA: hypothetical protein VF740_00715, partial [Candidatus Acidoferrum sp.]
MAAVIPVPVDIRKWLPGDSVYDGTLYVPENLGEGNYDVRIAMLDPRTAKPAIRFAVGGPSRRRMVCHGLADGESAVIRAIRASVGVLLAGASAFCSLAGTDPPAPEYFRVLKQPLASGPRITPYLRY